MSKLLWHDAKIEQPKTTDPVIGLTSNGYVVTVQYYPKRIIGKWYELATDEYFDAVDWWADYTLPHGWHISDDYYEGEDE